MSSHDSAAHSATKPPMPGGIANLRPVDNEDLKIWDTYKGHLEKKIQKQFDVPKTHQLKPTHVATQVVAGQNYFFKVELHNKKFATARVYHVPWQSETHGKEEQVAVHPKLGDKADEPINHF